LSCSRRHFRHELRVIKRKAAIVLKVLIAPLVSSLHVVPHFDERMYPVVVVVWFSLLLLTSAKTIVITVGGNTTSNPGAVFVPQTVRADQDDVILFNCQSFISSL